MVLDEAFKLKKIAPTIIGYKSGKTGSSASETSQKVYTPKMT